MNYLPKMSKALLWPALILAMLVGVGWPAVDAVYAASPGCNVQFISEDLTSNRFSGLPRHRLQVTIFYDGTVDPNNRPLLQVEYQDPTNLATGWITIGDASDPGGPIDVFDQQIETRATTPA